MSFFLQLHSGMRYLVLLVGVALILYAIRGAIGNKPHDDTIKKLAIGFRSLMDITLFVGVVMIVMGYGFYNDLGVHILVMTGATAVAHLVPAVMRKRPQEERTVLPYAVATAISLALVVMGTMSIRT